MSDLDVPIAQNFLGERKKLKPKLKASEDDLLRATKPGSGGRPVSHIHSLSAASLIPRAERERDEGQNDPFQVLGLTGDC